MINKIKTIIFSRIQKPNNEKWVADRRKECYKCEWNTENQKRIPFEKLVIKKLSDSFSWLVGKSQEDNLGNCTACSSCSIFYKSAEKVEDCPKGKWNKTE